MCEPLRLRACKYCGERPDTSDFTRFPYNTGQCYIVCDNLECPVRPQIYTTYSSRNECVAAWNKLNAEETSEWNHLIENRANQALGNMAKNGRGIRQDSLANLCDKLKTTVLNKNRNYGNSAFRTPLLASNVSPQEALLVRLSDKIARLETLLRGEPDRVQEPLEDTIFDIAGYCILLLAERSQKTT
ncbi:MAG: nucleotide modification associated domain-containing protein [Planctomycetia bacterium]|nr:nucleotide modification associated domain-containing protein [Planctomycetia bacterium]